MIILDTNVISETRKRKPDPNVMAWLNSEDPTNLYLTSITVGELMRGAFAIKDQAQLTRLSGVVAEIIETDFHGRLLPYDATAAQVYGRRVGVAQKTGIAISIADGQIASIAISNNNVPVATRDRAPFDALGVAVINPWDYQK
jgi:predicted nucleic acid-binding protein